MKFVLLCALIVSACYATSLKEDLLQIGTNLLKTKTHEHDVLLAQTISTIDYNTIRNFVGCESGISSALETIFTVIDIVESDSWSWQVIIFGLIYLYAFYQQNFPALQFYCSSLAHM